MDSNNQQTTQTNSVNDGYNVTIKVDPSSLPTTQINTDLEKLKQAETFMTGRLSTNSNLNNPIMRKDALASPKETDTAISSVADSDKDQVLKALSLKNPFKGE